MCGNSPLFNKLRIVLMASSWPRTWFNPSGLYFSTQGNCAMKKISILDRLRANERVSQDLSQKLTQLRASQRENEDINVWERKPVEKTPMDVDVLDTDSHNVVMSYKDSSGWFGKHDAPSTLSISAPQPTCPPPSGYTNFLPDNVVNYKRFRKPLHQLPKTGQKTS
eukprot:Blabericola_migrator_1__6735@NODE_3400_length_1806_cov_41_019551_g998_i2_p2_GENE_NODE_3400_length_1806_cov_41_019551_g998_i2NODE_3400_length_1806_cov_41_019551_g998_i2_p2_ORF_typecomplete_len166_score21_66SPECT1/PF18680_1/0_051_NODE_3400_length_1806_cov_41_019551_g998_i2275772